MGCSAAKNLTIEPLNGHTSVKRLSTTRNTSISTKKNSDPALESEEPQTEILENLTINNVQETPNGLSFDIAFEEENAEDNESIVKKHPPIRLQKFDEKQPNSKPPISLEQLQEKLEDAEERRKQVLQQRMESARNSIRKQSNSFLNDETDNQNVL